MTEKTSDEQRSASGSPPAGRPRPPEIPTAADPELINETEPGREPRRGWLSKIFP
jgi:hypothetical protein